MLSGVLIFLAVVALALFIAINLMIVVVLFRRASRTFVRAVKERLASSSSETNAERTRLLVPPLNHVR